MTTDQTADPTADGATTGAAATEVAATGTAEVTTADVPTADPIVPVPTDVAVLAALTGPAEAVPTAGRRTRILGRLGWAAARIVAIALFVVGAALGYNAFVANQPESVSFVDPATDGIEAPAVVREFITALTSNDEAALRSAVPAGPYSQLVTEMQRWQFQEVTGVETLSTFADGPRVATEIVMSGRTPDGTPTSINLVVHVADGQIAMFR